MRVRKVLRVKSLGFCHEWTGGTRNKDGYGARWYKGRMWLAHRAAWDEEVGPIPDGMHVLHRCDNPPCVRRSHLFVGTHKDNMEDKMSKGRGNQKGMPGVVNPSAVLNDCAVQEIRDRYAEGGVTQSALAVEYGISQIQVSRIIRFEKWKMRGLESIGD